MISSSALRNLASITRRSSSRLAPIVTRSSVSGLACIASNHNVLHTKHAATQQQRLSFSSMGMLPRRGFPQYTVFDQDCALVIRPQMPMFKKAGSDGISVERRGKLILEFVPRNAGGTGYAWDDKVLFSLTVEEIGLCVSQLPAAGVELSHRLHFGSQSDSDEGAGVQQVSGDLIDKVLTIEPKEGAALLFKVDYVKDGIGGQSPDGKHPTPGGVTLQAGEFEVVKSIFLTSIPYLLGWNATMDLAAAAAISKGASSI